MLQIKRLLGGYMKRRMASVSFCNYLKALMKMPRR